jgi:hypothetical protein
MDRLAFHTTYELSFSPPSLPYPLFHLVHLLSFIFYFILFYFILVWFGLVWFGLVWFGLVCFVLFCVILFCFVLFCFNLIYFICVISCLFIYF